MSCTCLQPLTVDALAGAIIKQAARFIGLREVRPNAEWDNPKTPGKDTALSDELIALMLPTPWKPGWAYCAAFAEGIVAAAIAQAGGTPAQVAAFRAVMTAGVLDTRNRFRAKGLLTQAPEPGAIWLAQHGTGSTGHAGIVTGLIKGRLLTIEANTSLDSKDPAKDREGDWITTREFAPAGRGTLKTVGYVTPASILKLIAA